MSAFIDTYMPYESEYKQLDVAAKMLTLFNGKGFRYYVGNTYFDYGQDWKWTTILKEDPNETGVLRVCQALNPRQQENIIMADTPEEMAKAVRDVLKN